jgi:Putative addiction module component
MLGWLCFRISPQKDWLECPFQLFFDMAMTVEQIAEEALALPSESRALLADKLVESLDTAALSHIDNTWLAEAKRRRDEVRSGGIKTIPGDDALAKVRREQGR